MSDRVKAISGHIRLGKGPTPDVIEITCKGTGGSPEDLAKFKLELELLAKACHLRVRKFNATKEVKKKATKK